MRIIAGSSEPRRYDIAGSLVDTIAQLSRPALMALAARCYHAGYHSVLADIRGEFQARDARRRAA